MSNENDKIQEEQEFAGDEAKKPEQSNDRSVSLVEMLRQLRLRKYGADSQRADPEPESSGPDAGVSGLIEEQESDDSIEVVEEPETEDQGLRLAVDELGLEVRRIGREMFRSNRVSERNQEIFDEAIGEIRRLTSTVARISEQHDDLIKNTKIEALSGVCLDLLRMSDTLRASLSAIDEIIDQLRIKADHPRHWLAHRFAATRRLTDSLDESMGMIEQLREGQLLLHDRLLEILKSAGVREIETSGKNFDPRFHRAVQTAQRPDLAPGTIVGEELKGYILEGRILRYAEVIVSK